MREQSYLEKVRSWGYAEMVCAIKWSILKSANDVMTKKYRNRLRFKHENNHIYYDSSYTIVLITNIFLDSCETLSPWKNGIFSSMGNMP